MSQADHEHLALGDKSLSEALYRPVSCILFWSCDDRVGGEIRGISWRSAWFLGQSPLRRERNIVCSCHSATTEMALSMKPASLALR
jgi:hypothetical protein